VTRGVLVVDDNEHNREYARQVLASCWRVRTAADGEAALAAVAVASPDLVLLDLSMPRMDGWEVLRRLRQADATRAIPVVGCTAHAMAGDRERVLAAGFDSYLAKPYRADELVSCVEAFLGAPEAHPDEGWGDDDWTLDEGAWDARA
jgi:CheY-like chemotaxis protein